MSLFLALGVAIILLAGCAYYPAGYGAVYDSTVVAPYGYPYSYGYDAGYGYVFPRHHFYYGHHSHGRKIHPKPFIRQDRYYKGYNNGHYQNRNEPGGQFRPGRDSRGQIRRDGHESRQGFKLSGRRR